GPSPALSRGSAAWPPACTVFRRTRAGRRHMGFGRVGMALVLAAGIGCAHFGASRPDRPVLAAGKYAVESIRSRAQLDGIDQLIEISETGTKLTDANGDRKSTRLNSSHRTISYAVF